jgi:hypothetical protein
MKNLIHSVISRRAIIVKKILFVLLVLVSVMSTSLLQAAPGSCVQSNVYMVTSTGDPPDEFRVLEFNCTFGTAGDAGTALTSIVTASNMLLLKGMYLLMGTTYDGATAPTAAYDIYLRETVGATANAVDILGGAGVDRPGSAGASSQLTPNTSTTLLSSKPRPALNTLQFTASGNAVVSGNFIGQFIFVK